MKIVALTDCPQGQEAGDVFEVPDEHGEILIQVGAARLATEADQPVPAEAKSPRRAYRRRDLTAEP